MKLIIDRVLEVGTNTDELFNSTFYIVLLYIFLSFFMSIVFRFYDWMTILAFPKMKKEMIQEMFEYVEGHSYSYFQDNFAGSLSNKILDMSKSATTLIGNFIDYFIARGVSLIIGAITMYLVHPFFAYTIVIWGLVFLAASVLLSKKAEYYSEEYSEARSHVVGRVVDSLSNIFSIKLFSREGSESLYLERSLNDGVTKDKRLRFYLLKVKIIYGVTITLLVTIMIFLLIYARSKNYVTIGDFALILTLTSWLIEELWFVANQLVTFSEDVGVCRQALSIISAPHALVDEPHSKELEVTRGEIVYDQVHFRYKDAESIFENKSIVIRPQEKVGLVGFSGSGKSTFVNLILRFFDIDSGKILIDGQDIKYVTQRSLRRQIAMIPQDPVLFHRTLMENIRFGRLDASDEEVILCLKMSHSHEFIEKLSEGYNSLVGERGVKLSGGQRQRVAIARAMLKNAPILILDEATSSLDSVTEHFIQESLKVLMQLKTTIVIAHRLSTLRMMDRILVFSEGKIIEDGTHKDLLKRNGHYAKLWSMQVGGFLGG